MRGRPVCRLHGGKGGGPTGESNGAYRTGRYASGRASAIDGRTTRHGGYVVSQCIRKRIEEGFGWMKTVAGLRKTRYRGIEKVGWAFTFAVAAYNLVRLPKLLAGASP